MADIRYTTAVIDDFNRADENPIQAPWTRNWSGGIDCSLESNTIGSPTSNPNNSAQSYWSTTSFSGDAIESWGVASGAAALHDSYRMGLCDDAAGMNGYILRNENSVASNRWALRKYTNGVATNIAIVNASLPTAGDMVLMQLDATTVSCYVSFDSGANWTLRVAAADSDYRSGLFLQFGTNGSGPGWDAIGGGTPTTHRTQIYRIIKGFDQ